MTSATLHSDTKSKVWITVLLGDGLEAVGRAGRDVDGHFCAAVIAAGVLDGDCILLRS